MRLNVGNGYEWEIKERISPKSFRILIYPGGEENRATVKELEFFANKAKDRAVLAFLDNGKVAMRKTSNNLRTTTKSTKAPVHRDIAWKLMREVMKEAKKSRLPILQNILIKPGKITATDLEVFLTIPQETNCANAFLVNFDLIDKAKKILPEGKVKINESKIEIGSYSIPTAELSPDDFPLAPTLKKIVGHAEIPGGKIAHLLTHVKKDEEHYSLRGIYFAEDYAVATDGSRLLAYKTPTGGEPFIINPRFARLISHLDTVEIKTDGKISKVEGDFEILGRDIEGGFPDFKAILREESAYILSVKKKEILKHINAILKVNPHNPFGMTFYLDNSGSRIETKISVNKSLTETIFYKEELKARFNGSALRITLDPKFLKDMLIPIPHETTVKLEMDSPTDPIIIQYDKMIGLLMPIKP